MKVQNIKDILEDVLNNKINELQKIIFSDSNSENKIKITIRPITIKNNLILQLEKIENNQAFHFNLNLKEDNLNEIYDLIINFKQINIKLKDSDIHITNNQNKIKIKTQNTKNTIYNLSHNIQKNIL